MLAATSFLLASSTANWVRYSASALPSWPLKREKLAAAGITYQNYDGANNQATQLDQINTAITNGANLRT